MNSALTLLCRFLFEKNSKDYLYYRRKVAEIRRDTSAQSDGEQKLRLNKRNNSTKCLWRDRERFTRQIDTV